MRVCRFFDDLADPRAWEPLALGHLLKPVLAAARPEVRGTPSAALARLAALWSEAAGPDIAARTRATRFRAGVLEVEVDSTPLLADLRGFARAALIKTLSARGLAGVHDIRFRVRGSRLGSASC